MWTSATLSRVVSAQPAGLEARGDSESVRPTLSPLGVVLPPPVFAQQASICDKTFLSLRGSVRARSTLLCQIFRTRRTLHVGLAF